VDEHFCVPINSFVELLVGVLRVIDADLMGNNERRLCFPSNLYRVSKSVDFLAQDTDDQISQVSVISFDIALSCRKRKTFLEQLAKGYQDLTFPRLVIWCTWV
jgi:hypothetical protein